MKVRRQVTGATDDQAPPNLEEVATKEEDYEKEKDLQPVENLKTEAKPAVNDALSQSSNSSNEPTDGEGRLAIKSIEMIMKGNLDIKPLNLNISAMRKFEHTPKNGIRVPCDSGFSLNMLKNDGFIIFNEEDRPVQKAISHIQSPAGKNSPSVKDSARSSGRKSPAKFK